MPVSTLSTFTELLMLDDVVTRDEFLEVKRKFLKVVNCSNFRVPETVVTPFPT